MLLLPLCVIRGVFLEEPCCSNLVFLVHEDQDHRCCEDQGQDEHRRPDAFPMTVSDDRTDSVNPNGFNILSEGIYLGLLLIFSHNHRQAHQMVENSRAQSVENRTVSKDVGLDIASTEGKLRYLWLPTISALQTAGTHRVSRTISRFVPTCQRE